MVTELLVLYNCIQFNQVTACLRQKWCGTYGVYSTFGTKRPLEQAPEVWPIRTLHKMYQTCQFSVSHYSRQHPKHKSYLVHLAIHRVTKATKAMCKYCGRFVDPIQILMPQLFKITGILLNFLISVLLILSTVIITHFNTDNESNMS
jgi:hypothetical protein